MNVKKTARRGFSKNKDTKKAIEEIKEQLGNINNYQIIIFFAASSYSPKEVSEGFQDAFPNIQHVGASTCGELITGKTMQNSIVAIALDKNIIKNFSIKIVENIYKIQDLDAAFDLTKRDLGEAKVDAHSDKYVGMVLTNSFSNQDEAIIARLNEITEVTFIGASAADNWKLKETYIYANGQYYTKSALLVLFEPTVGFRVKKAVIEPIQ